MVKKRLERRQRGYENYKKIAGKILLVATMMGFGYCAASVVNQAFGLKSEAMRLATLENKGIMPYVRETMIPNISHAFFLIFLYLAIFFVALYFMYGKNEFKMYACSSFVASAIFGFVRPSFNIYKASKELKETMASIKSALAEGKEPPYPSVKDYVLKSFLPSYLEMIAIIIMLLGIIALAYYFLKRVELAREVGCAMFLVAGFFGATGRGILLYVMLPRLRETIGMVESYIAQGYGDQIGFNSVEEFIGKNVVPFVLDNVSFILMLAAGSLVAIYFVWKADWGKSIGGVMLIIGGFLAAFKVFLQTSFDSQKLSKEIDAIKPTLEGGKPFSSYLGNWQMQISSPLGYYVRKFIPYYLDQFSMFLFYVSIIVLALYVMRKEF